MIRSARGAIIIQVAFALIALLAFMTFVVDQGLALVARRQAQNAADAAALAGAYSLMLDHTDGAGATAAARHYANVNPVWGQATDQAHIVVPSPPIACPDGNLACVRVDVFRGMPDRDNAAHDNTLPTFFGHLVGIQEQGVRATATAHVGAGNSVNCIKPWTVSDKWLDTNGGGSNASGWDLDDTFTAGVDVYQKPGFKATGPDNDYGMQMTLKGDQNLWSSGWSMIIELGGGNGSNTYRDEIAGCPEWVPKVGLYDPAFPCDSRDDTNEERGCINVRPGNRVGPTRQGVADLVALDPSARWDTAANRVAGGCTDSGTCTNPTGVAVSPRIVPIAIFDPQACLDSSCHQGNNTVVQVVNLLGYFVEGMCDDVFHGPAPSWCGKHPGQTVVGRLVDYPGQNSGGAGSAGPHSFVKVVQLIR